MFEFRRLLTDLHKTEMWAIDHPTAKDDICRLDLPRILCLHGGGTNARIFRTQCRVLEAMLKPHFRLCYAQAPFFSQPGPDVQTVYSNYGPFRAWLRWSPDNAVGETDGVSDEIITAIDLAVRQDNLSGASGEWVGILGFSQGAKIGASILKAQQQNMRTGSPRLRTTAPSWQTFRFGILLAGRGPLVHFPTISNIDSTCGKLGRLSIPTIHVHGINDANLQLHRKLLHEHCEDGSASLIEWYGGHRVPVTTQAVSLVVDEMLSVFHDTGTKWPSTPVL